MRHLALKLVCAFGSVGCLTVEAQTNTWTQKANFGGAPCSYAAGFSAGGKGYVLRSNGNDFWEFDPAANTWTQKAAFPAPSRMLGVAYATGSKGYINTGLYNTSLPQSDHWEYDTGTNTWTQKANVPGGGRVEGSGFSIGNRAYTGLGFDIQTINNTQVNIWKNDMRVFDPATNTWPQNVPMGFPRHAAVAFSIGNRGYVCLGHDGYNYLSDLWEFDPATNAWTQRATFPGSPREWAVGFCIGTKGYIGTGNPSGGFYSNDFWEYDPVSNAWTQRASVGGATRRGAVGFAIGSKGYIGTGDHSGALGDFWEYDPGPLVLLLAPKVLLDGPFDQASQLMRDDLRTAGLIPSVEPFSAMGNVVTSSPFASVGAGVQNITGSNAIVDWVLVELRNPNSPGHVLAASVALLQRDGDVVALDGISPV